MGKAYLFKVHHAEQRRVTLCDTEVRRQLGRQVKAAGRRVQAVAAEAPQAEKKTGAVENGAATSGKQSRPAGPTKIIDCRRGEMTAVETCTREAENWAGTGQFIGTHAGKTVSASNEEKSGANRLVQAELNYQGRWSEESSEELCDGDRERDERQAGQSNQSDRFDHNGWRRQRNERTRENARQLREAPIPEEHVLKMLRALSKTSNSGKLLEAVQQGDWERVIKILQDVREEYEAFAETLALAGRREGSNLQLHRILDDIKHYAGQQARPRGGAQDGWRLAVEAVEELMRRVREALEEVEDRACHAGHRYNNRSSKKPRVAADEWARERSPMGTPPSPYRPSPDAERARQRSEEKEELRLKEENNQRLREAKAREKAAVENTQRDAGKARRDEEQRKREEAERATEKDEFRRQAAVQGERRRAEARSEEQAQELQRV